MTRRHLDPTDLDAVRSSVGLTDPASRLHPMGLERIVIGPEAIDEVARIVTELRKPGPIAVVGDRRAIARAGIDAKADVARRLAAVEPDVRIVSLGTSDAELHADATAIREAIAGAQGCGIIVAVGSGTVCDVAKEASRELGVPYVVLQTANSVNAFSDDMAVLLVNGVKRTMPSRWPTALVIDLTLVADAPAAMNRAGVGELAAMFTAPADWRLAAAVGMDTTWDRRVVDLFRDGADALLAAAPLATSHDETAQRSLAELMTLSGLALGIAGKTAPISGTEHTVSHLLDMAAARAGSPTGLHGAQVGVAALAVSVAWERLLADFDPESLLSTPVPSEQDMHDRITAAFSDLDPSAAMADECWAEYSAKLRRWTDNRGQLRAVVDDWAAVRRDLESLLGAPREIAAALRSAGAPATFDELDPPVSRDAAIWALFNGHLIRDRFTLADLAWFAGAWPPDGAAAAIDGAAEIAARAPAESRTIDTAATVAGGS
ncbi:MAG: iron-containing alcohol dehydrogenase [Chloroflexota bacterium]